MTRDEILQGVREVVAITFLSSVSDMGEYGEDEQLADLGLISQDVSCTYDFANFLFNLESRFGLEHIRDEVGDSWHTVGDVVNDILELLPEVTK